MDITVAHDIQLEFIDSILQISDAADIQEFISKERVVSKLVNDQSVKYSNVIEQAVYDIGALQAKVAFLESEDTAMQQNIRDLTTIVKELANPYYNEANLMIGLLCSRQGIY